MTLHVPFHCIVGRYCSCRHCRVTGPPTLISKWLPRSRLYYCSSFISHPLILQQATDPYGSMATEVCTGGRAQGEEVLPPTLGSGSQPPNLFDGTTRLYISYICPYVQRVWIARNYKGLQDKIELVAIDLQEKPAWFLEKVYPLGKVPVLEHNGNVIGESFDLIKYLDVNFEGPKLFPDDTEKKAFADELIACNDSVIAALFKAGRAEGDLVSDLAGPSLDKIEESLGRFSDGPFLLGQSMSAVDMVYAPFIERFKDFFAAVKLYDMTQERPKIKAWIEELNKIDAYAATWGDRRVQLAAMMKKFGLELPVA